jgi:hypothetical protein
MRKKKVFIHYNKPKSQQLGHMVMSVHFNNTCYMVRNVKVNVPIWSKERKKQPRCVMEGYCTAVEINGDEAIVK